MPYFLSAKGLAAVVWSCVQWRRVEAISAARSPNEHAPAVGWNGGGTIEAPEAERR